MYYPTYITQYVLHIYIFIYITYTTYITYTCYIQGYALIEYETFTDAEKAIQDLNGADILGSNVRVDWAFVRNPARSSKGLVI